MRGLVPTFASECRRTCSHGGSDRFQGRYSPITLTSTRFVRRPSNSP